MTTINERFKRARQSLGIKQTDIAKLFDSEPSFISNIERGLRAPPKRLLELFAKEYKVNLHWLFTNEGDMYIQEQKKSTKSNEDTEVKPMIPLSYRQFATFENTSKTGLKLFPIYSEADLPEGAFVVPLLDQQLCAGSGSQVPDEDASSALVRVPGYLSKYGDKVAALKVDGDSMYPTLSRGDMVVCDSCGWTGEGIYALRMSGSGFVKRLTKAPGKLIIISDNPKYPPREEPEESQDIQIIGRVHCAITKVE